MTSLRKAQALLDLRRHEEARAEVTRVLAGEPGSVLALCLLARCELALDDPAAALVASGRAVAADPELDWALRLHALALTGLSRLREAREAATAAVRAGPEDWLNHHVLAETLSASGRHAEAYAAARRAVELAPEEPDAHVMHGIVADRTRRRREARAAYREALRLDPGSAVALNNLAAMDINRSRLGRAARHVTAGLRSDPAQQALHHNLDAVALRLMGRLTTVMLLTGVLPLAVIASEVDHAWWVRAAIGTVQICTYTLVAWLTLRHLPRGAVRRLRGLPRRMTTAQRCYGVALVVLTLALLCTAFMPGSWWLAGAGVLAVMVYLFQALFVCWVITAPIRWLLGKARE